MDVSKNTKTCILVLDIDGALTDSVAMHQEAFLQALGIPRLDTRWGSYQRRTDTGILTEAVARADLPRKSPQQVSDFEADLAERFLRLLRTSTLREIKGARKLTEHTAQSKWGVLYATGGMRGVSRAKLEAVGIPYSEETLITSSEYENRTELVASAIQRAKEVYHVAEPMG
jgi:beta-phosphoglucomutase-like phosphatase (HAD superfamily)